MTIKKRNIEESKIPNATFELPLTMNRSALPCLACLRSRPPIGSSEGTILWMTCNMCNTSPAPFTNCEKRENNENKIPFVESTRVSPGYSHGCSRATPRQAALNAFNNFCDRAEVAESHWMTSNHVEFIFQHVRTCAFWEWLHCCKRY